MAKNKQDKKPIIREKRDPKNEKEALISKAKASLENLSEMVSEYELETRASYEKERQIKNIVNNANTISYNKTKNVFSIATELSTVRELVFNIQNVDGILESFNRGIERLTKKGAYDEIPKQLEMATEFTASLNKQIKDLNDLILQKLDEGFGSRRDLARFEADKKNAAREELKELKAQIAEAYSSGELFSKLESQLKDKVSDEAIINLKNQHTNAFLESSKDKIFKAMASKKDYTLVADQFEIETKILYSFLSSAEKDEKLEKAIEEIDKKLFNTIANSLIAGEVTVAELHKKYPKSLVKKITSMIKEKEPDEAKKEISEKQA